MRKPQALAWDGWKGVFVVAREGKPKKPFFKKWWFWVIVLFVAFVAIGSSGSKDSDSADHVEDETEQISAELEPEESPVEPSDEIEPQAPDLSDADRDIVIAADRDILQFCAYAESAYNSFLETLSSENVSDLESYNAAKDARGTITNCQMGLVDVECKGEDGYTMDGFNDYNQTASTYVYSMKDAVEKAMRYIDDPSTGKLSDFQDAVEAISNWRLQTVTARIEFYDGLGFELEEIPDAS